MATTRSTSLKTLWLQARRQAKAYSGKSQGSEAGLTLIECIVAILLISITVTMVTPPIFLAVATRIQNQRIEQALQLGQSEIDRIKLMVNRGAYTNDDLPPEMTSASLVEMSAPTALQADRDAVYAATGGSDSPTDAFAVDIDSDGDADFAVQAFRNEGQANTTGDLVAFGMGVRVYSARAFDGGTPTDTEQLTASFVAGDGAQLNNPLITLYTDVARGDVPDSFDTLNTYTTP